MMKEMLLMAAKSLPKEKIDSVKSGMADFLSQLIFAKKMSIKMMDDEEDVVAMGVFTNTKEFIVCPVTVRYQNGSTIICRELVDDGLSINRFIEHICFTSLVEAMSEKNEVKQMQMVVDVFKSAKDKSQITDTEKEDVEKSETKGESESESESESDK